MVFYDLLDKQPSIYVYYNKLAPPVFTSSYDQEILCRDPTTTSYQHVFADFKALKLLPEKNWDMTIQSMQGQFDNAILDITNPFDHFPELPLKGRIRV